MNLVQQQNMLKELSDGQLSQVMQSGTVPQYMVVAEAKRREEARKRYTTMKQKYDSTVADQVMQGLQPSAMSALGIPQQPPAAPGGLDAAMMGGAPDMGGMPMPPPDQGGGGLDAMMPPDQSMGQPPAFARGGAVHRYATPGVVSSMFAPEQMDALIKSRLEAAGMAGLPAAVPAGPSLEAAAGLPPMMPEPTAQQAALGPLTYDYPDFNDPYAGIRDLYSKQMADIDKEKEKAGALALISAGLGIAGGKSQNFARNLAGAQDAIKGYGENLDSLNERQQGLAQGLAQTEVMSKQAFDAMKKGFPDTQEGRIQMLRKMGIDASTPEAQAYILSGEGAERLMGISDPTDIDGPVPGTDGMNNRVDAWYDRVKKGWFTADGTPIEGFTRLSDADLAAEKTEAVLQAKAFGNPNAYYNDIGAINEASRQKNQVDTLVSDTKAALDQVSSTAGVNNWLAATGSGPLATIASKLGTLKALVAQLQLQKMRNASQDGSSGLGQITGRELDMLQSALGLLEMNQNKEDLIKNINYVQATYGSMIDNLQARFDSFWKDYKNRDTGYETKMFGGTGAPLAPGGTGGATPEAPASKSKLDTLFDTI